MSSIGEEVSKDSLNLWIELRSLERGSAKSELGLLTSDRRATWSQAQTRSSMHPRDCVRVEIVPFLSIS